MKKVISIFISCFIFIVIILLILNKTGYLIRITNNIILLYNKEAFVFFVILLNILIMVISSFFGYKMASIKNRNPIYWAFLCCFFNVWAYLILYFMKPIEKSKEATKGVTH